ncbi:MAG: biotin/lipoyl-binding protein, partial [Prevotella sp.]|nr:biotin/lipoyl-binding protein [Prevotella sp.]
MFFSSCKFGEDGIRHGKIIVNGHTIKNAHAGSIKRIFVREGDYINKGDTLMTINVQSQPLQQDPAVLKQKKDIAYATLMRCQ